MKSLVQLEHVTKTYDGLRAGGTPAAADVSLAVAAGEAVAIVEPSGSGKSTLLIPAALLSVYPPWELRLLALSGLLIAAAGALGPACWAARIRTATALRAE